VDKHIKFCKKIRRDHLGIRLSVICLVIQSNQQRKQCPADGDDDDDDGADDLGKYKFSRSMFIYPAYGQKLHYWQHIRPGKYGRGKTNNEQPALGHAIAINGNRKPMPDETPSSVCGRRRCTHTHVAGPKVHSEKLGVLGEINYLLFT